MINALNHPVFGVPNSINLDNLNFFNFLKNSGGRRAISIGLRVRFRIEAVTVKMQYK